MNHKKIKINQRIPLEVLSSALVSFIEGDFNEEYILQQLRLEFKGVNRLKKSVEIVNYIIQKSPLSDFISNNKALIKQAIKKKNDRSLIIISLLNSSYSFAFDALQFFGKYLSVQEVVNRETIKKSLSSIYGGNRSTEIAIDSVVPMFIEAGLIQRPEKALYQLNPDFAVVSPITRAIYLESFKIWFGYDEMQEYQLRDPYFIFI